MRSELLHGVGNAAGSQLAQRGLYVSGSDCCGIVYIIQAVLEPVQIKRFAPCAFG